MWVFSPGQAIARVCGRSCCAVGLLMILGGCGDWEYGAQGTGAGPGEAREQDQKSVVQPLARNLARERSVAVARPNELRKRALQRSDLAPDRSAEEIQALEQGCQQPCTRDRDCPAGLRCVATTEGGRACWPEDCGECFASGLGCRFHPRACDFVGCVDRGYSETCDQSCTTDSDCSPGETCFDLSEHGSRCWPSACGRCFSSGYACRANSTSCSFASCEANLLELNDPATGLRSRSCMQPCNGSEDCEGAERCVELRGIGRRCAAPRCRLCGFRGSDCLLESQTCNFLGCSGG